MVFDWEHVGTWIGGAAITLTAAVFAIGKGAAHFSKDLTTIKSGKNERWLYETQKQEIEECKTEIRVLKTEYEKLRVNHEKCEDRLDETEALIARLNLRIIDLQNNF